MDSLRGNTGKTIDSEALKSQSRSVGFVELPMVYWWTAGGVLASAFEALKARLCAGRTPSVGPELPKT